VAEPPLDEEMIRPLELGAALRPLPMHGASAHAPPEWLQGSTPVTRPCERIRPLMRALQLSCAGWRARTRKTTKANARKNVFQGRSPGASPTRVAPGGRHRRPPRSTSIYARSASAFDCGGVGTRTAAHACRCGARQV